MKRTPSILIGLTLATLGGLSLACGGVVDKVTGGSLDIPISASVDSDKAEALVLMLKDGRFPSEQCRDKENALNFLWIAAAKTDAPTRAAAMDCVGDLYTHSASVDTKQMIDADYKLVINTLLDSEDDVVRARAIQAARISIDGDVPDMDAVGKLVKLANDGSAAERFEALSHLWYMDSWEKNADVAGAYLKALDADENYVVSESLFRIRSSYYNLVNAEDAVKKSTDLIKDDDAGVRGRAARALGALGGKHGDKGDIGDDLHGLLTDGHPYVRSEAASALASLKREASIHQFMNMIDDDEGNTYDIEGFKELDGSDGRVHHDGSAWSRVDDAVFSALKSMTYSMDDKYEYDINYDTKEDDIKKARDDARSWYKRNKSDLPAADAGVEEPGEGAEEDDSNEEPRAGKGGKGGKGSKFTGPRVRGGKGGGKAGKR